MKKSPTALFSGLFVMSVLLSLVTLGSGCVVRPIGYGGGYHHHHHHRGW